MITNKIKEYRKIKNKTQEELASALGVSRKTLSIIESGSVIPKIDIVYKLSLILEATVEELFYNEEYNELCLKKQEEYLTKIADAYLQIRK